MVQRLVNQKKKRQAPTGTCACGTDRSDQDLPLQVCVDLKVQIEHSPISIGWTDAHVWACRKCQALYVSTQFSPVNSGTAPDDTKVV